MSIVLNPFSGNFQLLNSSGGAGGGTVTSVGLSLPSIFTVTGSPVTGTGTLTGTFNTEPANTVFSGPTSGAAATPTFRLLVVADIPSLPYVSTTLTSTHILVGNGSNIATSVALSGDASLSNTGALTVNSVGGATSTEIGYLTGATSNIQTQINDIVTQEERVDLFTLNSTDISNGYVTLSGTPVTANNTILFVTSAPNQFYGVDYIVTTNQVTWNGLGLSGVLSSGDNLTVIYN